MADTVAIVSVEEELSVTVSDSNTVLTSSNLANPSIVESVDNIGDVDVTTEGKEHGSILVYRTTTNKWTSTRTLDAQNMEGGEF